MKLPVFIRGGKLNLPSHTREIIRQQKDGSYVFDLKREKSKATASMFGYLYGYVYPAILKEMGEFQTVENVDRLDIFLKSKFGKTHLKKHYSPSVASHAKIIIREKLESKPKSKYTVEEMQEFWIALQQFAAEFFNLTLTDPDPDWRKHWENKLQEIDSD